MISPDFAARVLIDGGSAAAARNVYSELARAVLSGVRARVGWATTAHGTEWSGDLRLFALQVDSYLPRGSVPVALVCHAMADGATVSSNSVRGTDAVYLRLSAASLSPLPDCKYVLSACAHPVTLIRAAELYAASVTMNLEEMLLRRMGALATAALDSVTPLLQGLTASPRALSLPFLNGSARSYYAAAGVQRRPSATVIRAFAPSQWTSVLSAHARL